MTDRSQTGLAAHPFFEAFTARQRELLTADARPVVFRVGERIFSEGGPADTFWLIGTGRVALDMWAPGRGEQIVETLAAGTVLGWSWLNPPYRWHFGAQARERTTAIAFDAAAVRRRCEADPVFGYAVLSRFIPIVIERMQTTRLRMLDLYAASEEMAQADERRAASPDTGRPR